MSIATTPSEGHKKRPVEWVKLAYEQHNPDRYLVPIH
jgi:hypothetical protein